MSEIFNNNYLTRITASQHLNERGIPVKASTINKMRMLGTGPEPDLYYGKTELFLPQTIEQWAEKALLSRRPNILHVNRKKDRAAA